MNRVDPSSHAVDNKMTANTNTGTGEDNTEEMSVVDMDADKDGDNAQTEALYDSSPITQGLAEPMSPNSVSVCYSITPIIKQTPKNSDDNANAIEILRLNSDASSQYGITPVMKQTPRNMASKREARN